MQFVTASETAVFMSAISAAVGSRDDMKDATATLANPSFTDKMRVRSKVGKGTSVVLEKILSKKAERR